MYYIITTIPQVGIVFCYAQIIGIMITTENHPVPDHYVELGTTTRFIFLPVIMNDMSFKNDGSMDSRASGSSRVDHKPVWDDSTVNGYGVCCSRRREGRRIVQL
jgi:hypothetical protein